MAITNCSICGTLYEAGSEEQANEPDRMCRWCVRHMTDCTCTRSLLGARGPHKDTCPAARRKEAPYG